MRTRRPNGTAGWMRFGVLVMTVLFLLAPIAARAADDETAGPGSAAANVVVKEYALAEALTFEQTGGKTDVLITDLRNGLEVLPRSVTAAGTGTRIELPQLPRGRFRVRIGAEERLLIITDQTGNSTPVDGTPAAPRRSPYLPGGLMIAGVVGVVLLRGRSRFLGVAPILIAGALWFGTHESGTRTLTWSECDVAWSAETPAEDGYFARRDCHATYLVALLERNDTATIEEVLSRNTNFSLCHDVTQLAGLEYLRKHRLEPTLLARTVIPGCIDGVVHGAVAAWSMYRPDETFMAEVSALCGALDTTRSQRSCLHGLGHAALNRTNGDLYRAWDLCEAAPRLRNHGDVRIILGYTLPESAYASDDDCRGAAIMDWTNRVNIKRLLSPAIRVVPERTDMTTICQELPDGRIARILCYLATNFRDQDTEAATAFCREKAPNQEDCFAALGHNVARFLTTGGRSAEENLLRHVQACRSGAGAAGRACLLTLTAAIREDRSLGALCRKATTGRPEDQPVCG